MSTKKVMICTKCGGELYYKESENVISKYKIKYSKEGVLGVQFVKEEGSQLRDSYFQCADCGDCSANVEVDIDFLQTTDGRVISDEFIKYLAKKYEIEIDGVIEPLTMEGNEITRIDCNLEYSKEYSTYTVCLKDNQDRYLTIISNSYRVTDIVAIAIIDDSVKDNDRQLVFDISDFDDFDILDHSTKEKEDEEEKESVVDTDCFPF